LAYDFYDYQWFDGFSTNHPIKCPECDHPVTDDEFSNITDYLVKLEVLTRKIVYKIWLCPEQAKVYHSLIKNESYSFTDILKYYLGIPYLNNDYVEIVYFPKYNINGYKDHYIFEYRSKEITELMPQLQRELVEYVFHPSRIKCIERLDEI